MAPPVETQAESAEHAFRRLYRLEWEKFLSSPIGVALISAVYSQRPPSFPHPIAHNDSHSLGRIHQHELVMQFLAVTLRSNLTSTSREVEQNYPGDENPQTTEKD